MTVTSRFQLGVRKVRLLPHLRLDGLGLLKVENQLFNLKRSKRPNLLLFERTENAALLLRAQTRIDSVAILVGSAIKQNLR